MRLGTYPCQLAEGSRAHQAYGSLLVHERHRHRYEFNNQYRQQFAPTAWRSRAPARTASSSR